MKFSQNLKDKTIILTGACGGIGRKILEALHNNGASIIAVDLCIDNTLVLMYPDIKFYECDLTEAASFMEIANDVVADYGKITNLINAHGVAGNYPLADVTLEEFNRVMVANLYSVLMTCQTVIPIMVANGGGNIVSLSSNLAYSCLPFNLPYTLSKSGINALTKTIAKEYVDKGIIINAICPSVVATDMFISYVKDEAEKCGMTYEDKRKELLSTLPQKRWLVPEEIANLALYLSSDAAKGITGQSIPINMGSYMF